MSKSSNKEKYQYTFDDWVNNKFWNEKGFTGQYVCNDSEQYLHLVSMGKMTYEVLNKIQDEQNKAYDYLIECTLKTNERFFEKQAEKSLDLQKVIDIKIKRIEKYIQENEDLYYDVILPKLHRGIKIGAKYILPEQYLEYRNNGFLDAFIVVQAPYQVGINGKLVSFPTDEQKKYAEMEAQVLWLKRLQEYKKENGKKSSQETNEATCINGMTKEFLMNIAAEKMLLFGIYDENNKNAFGISHYHEANCHEDYVKVFERQAQRNNAADLEVYKQELINYIDNCINDLNTNTTPKERLNLSHIKSAYVNFKEWLTGYNVNPNSANVKIAFGYDTLFNSIKQKFYDDNNNDPDKIKVAALLEIFATKGYFGNEAKPKNKNGKIKNPVKIWEQIALKYFETPLAVQLSSKDKTDRETHKKQLQKYFR